MERAADAAVWEYAKQNQFVIVTKVSDFTTSVSYVVLSARDLAESRKHYESESNAACARSSHIN